MRLQFNSLVLIPSDHCNISCRHCYPECGPTSKFAWNVNLFRRCISEASCIPELNKMVHFAGGEPFLYFKEMLELAHHACEYGFSISLVTNGFWGARPERARKQIASLVNQGLKRVELSADRFHQEFIQIETIKSAIHILKELGVSTILRVVTTREHMVDETLRQLDADDLDGLEVAGSPMVPVGRALMAVQAEEYYLSASGACGSCSENLNLTVRSDGNVSPCCAGSDMTPSLSLGNVNSESLDIIVRKAEWNYLVKKLVHQGPSSFFSILESAGLGHKIKDNYTNICHACSDFFGDEEVVQAVEEYLFDLQRRTLASCLAELPAKAGIEWSFSPPHLDGEDTKFHETELVQIEPLAKRI